MDRRYALAAYFAATFTLTWVSELIVFGESTPAARIILAGYPDTRRNEGATLARNSLERAS